MQVWILLVIIIVLVFIYYNDVGRWMRWTVNVVEPTYNMTRRAMISLGLSDQSKTTTATSSSESTSAGASVGSSAETTTTVATTAINATKEETQEALARKLIIEGLQSADSAAQAVDDGAAADDTTDACDRTASSATFAEWIDRTSIDPSVYTAHRAYVAERMRDNQTQCLTTARPIDRHDTYDVVPWQGLARPARVPVDSPDQLPDLDYDRYAPTSRVKWSSDVYE